jgi:hypothetical protein
MPKRKIKEEKPKKKLGKKEILIAPIAMGAATLLGLVIIPAVAPPPNPLDVCLKGHNIDTDFQLHPHIQVFVDGKQKWLPDNVGQQPKNGQPCMRPIHTDQVGDVVHIEYPRDIRFNLANFMQIYSYDNRTITVVDNSTGLPQQEVLPLSNYTVQYSYNTDKGFLKLVSPSNSPPFTNDFLARIDLQSKK